LNPGTKNPAAHTAPNISGPQVVGNSAMGTVTITAIAVAM
jgi:hypothetical protein